MFGPIALFELKYHVKTPLFAIALVLAFGFGLIAVVEAEFGSSTAVHVNAPWVVMQILLMASMFGTLTTTAFVVNSIHRDFELNMDSLFFSRPLSKLQYMAGRFAGSFAASLLIFLGIFAAIAVAPLTGLAPKEQLGPIDAGALLYSLFVLVVPNLLFIGAVLFAVAALTRSLMWTYATMAVMALLYAVSMTMAWDIEKELLANLMDPFGIVSFFRATRYWTVFDKNTRVVPLEGLFLLNRVFWLGVGGAFLGAAYAAFNFTARGGRKTRRQLDTPAEAQPVWDARSLRVEPVYRSLSQFGAIVRLEAVNTLKSVPFVVIMLCAIFLVFGEAMEGARFGQTYPVTREMIESIAEGFLVFSVMIAAFYASDVVTRERSLKTSELSDAMPVPTWVQWSAKLASLLAVVAITLVVAVLTTLAIQTVKGYYNYELDLYARAIFLHYGSRLVMITAFAFVIQVFFQHKMAGIAGMAVWFLANTFVPAMGWAHPMYRFAAAPRTVYSDMNGYGHFVEPLVWFSIYWALFTGILLTLAHLLWVRGSEITFRQRLRIARQRFVRPVAATMAVLFLGFVSTGCFLYYNTNVLNEYQTGDDLRAIAAETEKRYKKYEDLPQPRIVAVQANVDIYPERRALHVAGSYVAVNKSSAPIRDVHVIWSPTRLTTAAVSIPGAKLTTDDPKHGYRIYRLAEPLQPGASLTMTYKTAYEPKGFLALGSNLKVVENGTFANNFDFFPHLGYNGRGELSDDREEHGLPPLERAKPPHDPKAVNEIAGARNTDFLSLDTTVSTSVDQIAVAPGYLQKEWTANGRRYFHYKTTSPIRGFWSYLSARYEVKRDSWNGMPIEVYYDEKHPYNVDAMIDAVKKSLDYYTKHFSPYQHKQVRILEFPAYANFAQAFPNTIPWSESLGFVTDMRDENRLNYVFYVAAHEIAHQWWGHQVTPANVQGAAMMTESLAQYSALMVLRKEIPESKMRRYLRYELDRYQGLRGNERLREMPLMLVERQDYIHYQKGALVMYALQDYLGEETVNRALRRFMKDHAFSGPPYATATNLVKYIRAEAPPRYQELITDLFERIVLYDLETRDATVTRRADGKYVVKLTLATNKVRSDGKGEETSVPIDDWIDVGVFGADEGTDLGKTLHLQKVRITRPAQTLEIVVNEKPGRAGIDPFHKLIDRQIKDNTKSL